MSIITHADKPKPCPRPYRIHGLRTDRFLAPPLLSYLLYLLFLLFQAAVLALGAAGERVLPNDDPDSEQIYRVATMLTATCSFDHRVIDGAVGAQWLAAYKKLVESPMTMLL